MQTESGLLAALEKVKAANLTVDGASVIPFLADGNSFNGASWTSNYGSVGTLTIMFGGMPVDAEDNWISYYRLPAVLDKASSVGSGWLQTFISKNPEAVAKFLNFMTSDEGLACWNYGEPGVDCEIAEAGLYTRTEEGFKKSNNAAVTGVGAFWAFCNQNWDQKHMDPSTDQGIVPQCAMGTHEKTCKYNSVALDTLGLKKVEDYRNEPVQNNYKTIELAAMVLASLLMIIAYPFAQKYFVQGVLLGYVKGQAGKRRLHIEF